MLFVGPDDPRLADISQERLQGVRRVLDDRHIRTVTVPIELDSAREPISAAVHKNPSVDAVFAYNDEVALIVLQVLREAGIGVPKDISVIGCDNLQLPPR